MKSTAIYKLIRELIGPWTKEAGFKRGSGGMLAYVRPNSDGSTFETFWFQCSQDGWDGHTGSKFTLEFQKAPERGPGHGNSRARFNRFLSDEEREQVRLLQNVGIRKLQRPPRDHWAHSADGDLKQWYFARFDEERGPYRASDDIWLRYADEADVRRWVDFLLPLLPKMLERFRTKDDVAGGGA